MDILEKLKESAQSTEEPIIVIRKGIKYKLIEDWWIPIQIMPTVRLIEQDFPKINQVDEKILTPVHGKK